MLRGSAQNSSLERAQRNLLRRNERKKFFEITNEKSIGEKARRKRLLEIGTAVERAKECAEEAAVEERRGKALAKECMGKALA